MVVMMDLRGHKNHCFLDCYKELDLIDLNYVVLLQLQYMCLTKN